MRIFPLNPHTLPGASIANTAERVDRVIISFQTFLWLPTPKSNATASQRSIVDTSGDIFRTCHF
jgi:hypothetical protein